MRLYLLALALVLTGCGPEAVCKATGKTRLRETATRTCFRFQGTMMDSCGGLTPPGMPFRYETTPGGLEAEWSCQQVWTEWR